MGGCGRVEAFSCGRIRGVTSRSLAVVSGSMLCVYAPHVVYLELLGVSVEDVERAGLGFNLLCGKCRRY